MKVSISNGYLNIKKHPTTDSQVIGTLNKGDKVIVRCIDNGWAKIDHNNELVYVSA